MTKYLILRRLTQITILALYFGANYYGWKMLAGNLSFSTILGVIPLSDPYAVAQMLFAGAVLASDVLLGAGIIILFYSIVGGRAFCSWVCPINMVTDFASWSRKVLGINKIAKKQPSSRNIRYWTLVIGLVISSILSVAAFEFISPISMIHRGIAFGFGFGFAVILSIYLFDLFVLKDGWCGHICPLGGFYSLIGRFSLIRVHHNSENCTNCMKCKEICPETQVLFMINKESIPVLSGECTNCARCIDVCDDDALKFDIKSLNKTK
jgi:ferredoxin-type protein NapH